MTKDELHQLYYLNGEIEMHKRRLRELEQQPLASGDARIVADIYSIIGEVLQRCIAERERLEMFIAGIDDDFLRQVFICRFAAALSWREIALGLGGGNSSAGLRMMCYRYLKKSQ